MSMIQVCDLIHLTSFSFHCASLNLIPCHVVRLPTSLLILSSRPIGDTVNGTGTTSKPSPSCFKSVSGRYGSKWSSRGGTPKDRYDKGAKGLPTFQHWAITTMNRLTWNITLFNCQIRFLLLSCLLRLYPALKDGIDTPYRIQYRFHTLHRHTLTKPELLRVTRYPRAKDSQKSSVDDI
jgi:hypothetical protein